MFFIFGTDIISWIVIAIVVLIVLGLLLFTPLGLALAIIAFAAWIFAKGEPDDHEKL